MIKKMDSLPRTFSLDLWHGSLADQKRNGRCWIYASLNPLRQRIVERFGLEDFLFSTNYIYYYDQLEKSKKFLERMMELRDVPLSDAGLSDLLREPVSSVGQWCYFAVLAEEYGLVPLFCMPDTEDTVDGVRLTRMLNGRLRMGAKEIRESDDGEAVKAGILGDIRELLKCALGEPPEQFNWNGEAYTPLSFFKSCLDVDFSGYVMLMHHPSEYWPMNRAYHEEPDPDKRHPYLTMLNVDMEVMKELTLKQLQHKEQVVMACDVRHAGNRATGELSTEAYGSPKLNKADAIRYREINACHVMCIDGADETTGCWRVQDSHGSETGTDGHYVMTDAWFDAYVLSVVIKKEYLSPALRDALEKPVIYMPKTERF